MRILMTGGTGFLGGELARRLLLAGNELVILSRSPERVERKFGSAALAIRSFDELNSGDGFDAVINLAGEPMLAARWSDSRKQTLWESRVGVTSRLIDYLEKCPRPPQVLISGSAVGYYGDRGGTWLDEDCEPGSCDEFGVRLCVAWEQAANLAVRFGTRVCIVRTGLVIGRHGGFLRSLLPPFRLGLGGRIGNGRQWMSWIHQDDYSEMLLRLIAAPTMEGAFNAVSPNPVTNQEFARSLGKALGRPALLPLPAPVLKLFMGKMSTLLLGGQRAVPLRFREAGFEFRYPGLDAALVDALSP